MTDFKHTKAALEIYDATAGERKEKWQNLRSNQDAEDAMAADDAAIKAVQLAFYEDTKEYNSLDRCQMVGIKFIRHQATGHPGKGVITIGGVGFGQLTGETYSNGQPKWNHTHHIGDERVRLLEAVHDGKPLPEDLVLVGQIEGSCYDTITADAVDWTGLRSRSSINHSR